MSRKLGTYACYSILLVFALALTSLSPLLIDISRTFSLSIAQSGIFFTANFFGFVVFILIGGVLSDRWGKKVVISVSLIGFTAAMFIFPLSPGFYAACIVMFFIGSFGGVLESMASALVSDLNTVNNSFYVNLAQVFFGLGAIIGPVSAGIMVSSGLSWKLCYYILAVLSLAVTVIFISIKLPQMPGSREITLADFKHLVTDKKFILICLCMLFYTGSEVGGWGWMCTFLKQIMNFSVAKSGIAVAVFWAAMTIGRLLCGPLILRYNIKHLIIFLAFTSSTITALSIFINNEAAIWVIIAAMGLTYSSQWPLIVSYGSSYSKAPSGTVFSLLIGSGGIGVTLVPFIMGVIGEKTAMSISMIAPALLLSGVGLIFTAIGRLAQAKPGS